MACYCRDVSDEAEKQQSGGLPQRRVTINMLVAYNVAEYRRAAGLTQKQLGELLGWSEASVSAAERSWDGKRVREFDADEMVRIAGLLDLPLIALLLPPAGDGTKIDYAFTAGPDEMDSEALLTRVITDYQGDGPTVVAFRERLMNLGGSWFMGAVRREAAEIIVRARDQALGLIGEGNETAETLKRDAQLRHSLAMGSLVQEREELERRVDDLRAFEREYRTRLLVWLEAQIDDLKAGARDSGEFPAISTSGSLPPGDGDGQP